MCGGAGLVITEDMMHHALEIINSNYNGAENPKELCDRLNIDSEITVRIVTSIIQSRSVYLLGIFPTCPPEESGTYAFLMGVLIGRMEIADNLGLEG